MSAADRAPSQALTDIRLEEADHDRCLELLWRLCHSPDGVTAHCGRCGTRRRHYRARSRPSWECQTCGNHIHPTAGTIFHGTRTRLDLWFRAVGLLGPGERDVSVRELARDLGVSYKTARRMHQLISGALRSAGSPASGDRELLQLIASHREGTGAVVVLAGERERRRIRASKLRVVLGDGRVECPSEVQRRMLAGACRAIAKHGFTGTRTQDIAAEAGVSVARIYAYFETKEDLLLAAVDWANHEGTLTREGVIRSSRTSIEKLAQFLDLTIPHSRQIQEEHALYLELWASSAREHRVRPMIVRARARWHRYFEAIIREGVEAGDFSIPGKDIEEIVQRLVAISSGLNLEATVGYEWMPAERAREVLFRFTASELGLDTEELYRAIERGRDDERG